MTKKREFNSRWGNVVADDFQYCHVPGYILRNYAKCVSLVDVIDDKGEIDIKRGQIVGLDMQDMMFVIHVMAFKYDAPDGKAMPGLPKIAEYTGLHVTSVRRIKQKLMSFGLLTVQSEIGKTDVYNFSGLHDQCARLEQGLSQVEGIEATPSKSASGSKSARGWASKSARGTPSKSATRRIESDLEGKKENKPRVAQKDCDALIDVWAGILHLDMDAMQSDFHTKSARRHAKEMLLWVRPPSCAEFESSFKEYGKDFMPFEFLAGSIIKIRARPAAPVNPAHVPFAPAETIPDAVPMTDEARAAMNKLTKTVHVNDEVIHAELAKSA